MKLLMIVYSGSQPQGVTALLEAHGVHGWTELPRALGAGASGRREQTRAWPGDAVVLLTIVDAARVDELTTTLAQARDRLPQGERLHAAVLPVEHFF